MPGATTFNFSSSYLLAQFEPGQSVLLESCLLLTTPHLRRNHADRNMTYDITATMTSRACHTLESFSSCPSPVANYPRRPDVEPSRESIPVRTGIKTRNL